MDGMTYTFGTNAGKVWETLNTNGALSENQLCEYAGITTDELYAATGWLSRENKLNFCGDGNYCLGNTNKEEYIGTNAGKIWKVLDIWGEMDLTSICRLTYLNENDAFTALGWLACEDKVEGNTLSQYNNKKVFWLK